MSEGDNDRTTINVPKDSHRDAGEVKEEYDETWGDVLNFYHEFRSEVSRSLEVSQE